MVGWGAAGIAALWRALRGATVPGFVAASLAPLSAALPSADGAALPFAGVAATAAPPVTTGMLVVFAVVAVAVALFVTERLPVDVTALLVVVLLVVLGPWTGVSPEEGIAGFANEATITVLAMLILSAGVARTGVVQTLGRRMAEYAGSDLRKQLAVTVGVTGAASGFVNNTPVVAILVPVVTDLAHEGRTSPSKLLIPLSYASMLGGTLTLVGTSTNIVASEVSGRLIGHPFSMFEFTSLGLLVFLTGGLYLVFVGHRLLPERVPAAEGYVEEYDLAPYLAQVVVSPTSPLVGESVERAVREAAVDAEVLRVVREGRTLPASASSLTVRPGDVITLRTDRGTLARLADLVRLGTVGVPQTDGGDVAVERESGDRRLVEVVIPRDSYLVGESLGSTAFRERYDAAVLALRSRGTVVHDRLDRVRIRVGDTLLVLAPSVSVDRLARSPDVVVAREADDPDYRTEKAPVALAIVAGVVALAALDVSPILITALAGVVAMVAAGVLRPTELYDAVEWQVIVLLAGVLPLGTALEETGGAALLGSLAAASGEYLPLVAVLWLLYLVTGLVTEVVSNTASVVLMLPVAVRTATDLGADPFAFVLAVTFAASTAFLGPVGYQTNLFVYGPGGYRFTDYFRVGAPLQVLLSVVTVGGIVLLWGVTA